MVREVAIVVGKKSLEQESCTNIVDIYCVNNCVYQSQFVGNSNLPRAGCRADPGCVANRVST